MATPVPLRSPATKVRTTTEGVVAGTPAGVVALYAVSQFAPAMPMPVQVALVTLAVGLIGNVFSALRDRRLGGPVTGA